MTWCCSAWTWLPEAPESEPVNTWAVELARCSAPPNTTADPADAAEDAGPAAGVVDDDQPQGSNDQHAENQAGPPRVVHNLFSLGV